MVTMAQEDTGRRSDDREDPRSPGAAFALHVTYAQWRPLIPVLILVGVGLALVLVDFRVGAVVLGAATGLAFTLRAVLADDAAGILAVRAKYLDLLVLGLLTSALILLAVIVPQG